MQGYMPMTMTAFWLHPLLLPFARAGVGLSSCLDWLFGG